MATFTLNGDNVTVEAEPNAPLLWVVREHLGLTGTKFGCGIGQRGACTVHVEGASTYACLTPVSAVEGRQVTTIEGLSEDGTHPLQQAWIDEEVPQCGYCQPGQIMRAADLLSGNPQPSRDEIVAHMSTNICRCGTYTRIVRAIERAAGEAGNEA
ncbi:MAG: (2Fe-2S)-binding protein [Rhodospirillales bacterium]|nr:(2Fe-2S)-binding protein [Rhodospirillales bacterium]